MLSRDLVEKSIDIWSTTLTNWTIRFFYFKHVVLIYMLTSTNNTFLQLLLSKIGIIHTRLHLQITSMYLKDK